MGTGYKSPSETFVRLSTIEYCAAASLIGWGLWLLAWGPDQALSAEAFRAFRQRSWVQSGPWRFYGLSAVAIGVSYLTAIYINGRGMWWTPVVRAVSCLMVAGFFANLVQAIWRVQPSSTGVVTYGFVTVIFVALFVMNVDRLLHSLKLMTGIFGAKSS